jgi:hypothetical protein
MANPAKNNVVDIAASKLAEMEAQEAVKAAFTEKRNTFLGEMATLGAKDREGKQSPFKASMLFQNAVREGFIKADTDEARIAYNAYAGNENGNVLGVDKITSSAATQTSCLLTFGLSAAVFAGENFYVQIDAVISGYAAKDLYGSKIRCYEKANRELQKLFDAQFKANAGKTDDALLATVGLANDAAIASWLIKEGATKIGDGSEADGDGANGENAKAAKPALDRLNTLLTSLKAIVAKEFAGNAEFAKGLATISGEYHDLAKAAAKAAA